MAIVYINIYSQKRKNSVQEEITTWSSITGGVQKISKLKLIWSGLADKIGLPNIEIYNKITCISDLQIGELEIYDKF